MIDGLILSRWPGLTTPSVQYRRLAEIWQNALLSAPSIFVLAVLKRDWRFLSTTMLSCVVAATVATFQYAVYNSFRASSAVMPTIVAADYWVSAATISSFDFPAYFPEDYDAVLARYFPSGSTRRVIFGFVPWRSPIGRRSNVALVGIDGWTVDGHPIGPTGFVANRQDLDRLDLDDDGSDQATIGTETLHLEGTVDTMSTYLGAPYVLADFETARRLLGVDPSSVAFIAGNVGAVPATPISAAASDIERRFPDIMLRSQSDFARSSSDYWMNKTGAGLAIGLAAVLAMLLMVILLANGVLRFVQRYYSDLLSMLGHGAIQRDIGWIIMGVALIVSAVTLIGAVVITPILVFMFKPALPWVQFAVKDSLAAFGGVALAFVMAMLSARRALAQFAPDAIYRS